MIIDKDNIYKIQEHVASIFDGSKFCYQDGKCFGKLVTSEIRKDVNKDIYEYGFSLDDIHGAHQLIACKDDITFLDDGIHVIENNGLAVVGRQVFKDMCNIEDKDNYTLIYGDYDSNKYSEYLRKEAISKIWKPYSDWGCEIVGWCNDDEKFAKAFGIAGEICDDFLRQLKTHLKNFSDITSESLNLILYIPIYNIRIRFIFDWPLYVVSGDIKTIYIIEDKEMNDLSEVFEFFITKFRK